MRLGNQPVRQEQMGGAKTISIQRPGPMTKPFEKIKSDLKPDGALRDFYIQGISKREWNRFIAVAPGLAQRSQFKWGDKEVPLPETFSDIRTQENCEDYVIDEIIPKDKAEPQRR